MSPQPVPEATAPPVPEATAQAVIDAVLAFTSAAPGRAALVASADDGRILVRAGASLRPPAASLAKVPLVAAVLVAADAGAMDLATRVDPELLAPTRYPSIHAAVTTPLTLRELAGLAIVVSDNAAAQVLHDRLDDDAWTAAVEDLGLGGLPRAAGFTDRHLDGDASLRTTIDEQAAILGVVARDQRLAPLLGWMGDNLRNNRVSRMIPPPTRFHHKTGTLDGVLHDVGILVGAARRLVVVALTEKQGDPVATEVDMTTLGMELQVAVTS